MQIPVWRDHPVVVTECDWSPEKPGQGKFNEFGDYVPANHGSWGTATTARWGRSLRWAAEKLGNMSMMIGGVDQLFDVGEYLKSAEVKPAYDGDIECCGPYALKWYEEWAKAKPVRPGDFDKTRLAPLSGAKVRLSNLKSLCGNLFQMVAGGTELHMKAEGDGIDVMFGPQGSPGKSGEYCNLFKARPVKVDGKAYFRLKCYFPDGIVRLSNLEWGNGDSVYAGRNLDARKIRHRLPCLTGINGIISPWTRTRPERLP